MNSSIDRKDELVVYSLLIKVMDADNIQMQEEKDFLDNIKSRFGFNQADVQNAYAISLDECKRRIAKFSDDTRKELKDMLLEMANADGAYVKQEKELIDSLKLDISHYELELIADWLDDKQIIIGYYSQTKDGSFCLGDIRSLGFSELTYKDKGEIIIQTGKIEELEENTYYEFPWAIALDESERGFHLIPRNNDFKMLKPKELVKRLYSRWEKNNDINTLVSDVQKMVSTQLTASSDGTFIYELLQNANDYPVITNEKVELVDVEFHITDRYLIYRHTGRYFSPRNIAAISNYAAGEKKKAKNAIGYKGIGFKTVFSENQYVFLTSGEYTIRFDESITQESSRFPWQIMPIWTDYSEVDDEVKEVISDTKNFRVQMAIRPDNSSKLHNGDKSYEYIFNDIFKDEKDILFIPNIKSVKVYYDGEEQISRTKNPEKWCLTKEPLVYKFKAEEIEENNKEIIANKRIPEKYKDFEDTRVSFACQREGNILKPVEKSRIYCYLPTQVSLGLPFLMNTDMIPTGPRDNIEKEIKFNHKLMKIAGGKLTEWISNLLRCGEYDLCSVFTIIPSFAEVENYEDFISEFKEGFDETLETTELIPTEEGTYSLVSNTILDKTGITSSGIFTDEEFLRFTGLEGELPAKVLRNDSKFKSFLKEYVDDNNIFNKDSLLDLLDKEEFNEWLEIQDNNNKFIAFLLEKDYLQVFLDKNIFICSNGGLYSASDLYYDVELYLNYLSFFEDYIDYLSPKTKEYFKDNEKWINSIGDAFANFDCNDFVNDVLLSSGNIDDTKEQLRNKQASLNFYNFIAEYVTFKDNYKELPFFDDNDDVVNSFATFTFLSSKEAHEICDVEWLKSIEIDFLSRDYSDKVISYLIENDVVKVFSDDTIAYDIILSDEYHDSVVNDINEDITLSRSFVNYCFSNKDLFESGSLENYSLRVFDCGGNEQWYFVENDVFFQSSTYDFYSAKEWINSDWMTVLDEAYFDHYDSKDEFKRFLSKTFGVEELTDKTFYHKIVKKHLNGICENISGSSDGDGHKNIDFIKYLDDNYQLIFVDDKDVDIFSGMKLVTTDISNIEVDAENLYIYDNELDEIISKDWFPKDIVHICHKDYGISQALNAIGVQKYSFGVFYDDVIIKELDSINDTITCKEESVAFHTFIIDHLNLLTDDQKSKMVNANLYLYGNDEPSNTSGGHKILSASAKELCEKGLVEFSDLDIIDPDYKTEEKNPYWETILGNTKFTNASFYAWLKENQEAFIETLHDEELNIAFWRWLKDNAGDKLIEEVFTLPVLLKNGDVGDRDETIYLSNDYIGGSCIEETVLNFNEDALFVSPKYILENDNVQDWMCFWEKAGIKHEIVDILIDVINHLSEKEIDGLPKLIADNRESLEKIYDDGLITHLTDLKIKAGNDFYDIKDTIYVDCEKEEPFTYIILPNQILLNSAEERRLIKDIIQEVDGDCVRTLSEWQQHKLDRYLEMQENDSEEIRKFHYQFINDLSIIRNNEIGTIKELERIDEIKLLDRNEKFCDASELTMGSVYDPYFDFEQCEIELEYVSNDYNTKCSEYTGKLFRNIGIHYNFQEEDIEYLEKHKFAEYFWGKYISKKEASISDIKKYINDNKFDDIACIPTKDYMKCPSELYYGKEIGPFIEHIEDWENKYPLRILLDNLSLDGTTLFDLLPFKHSLAFLDALYALKDIEAQDKRIQLLKWMIEDYDSSYYYAIQEYRNDEHAKWHNNKKELKPIKDLYALEYGDRKLDQFFGANPRIINKSYLPSGESFKEACDILGIKIITQDDLEMMPEGKELYIERKKTHKLYALVLAGLIDFDNWKELYDGYCQRLEELSLYKCDSILITYKEDDVTTISQDLKKFYHKDGDNDFFFVKDLDGKLVYESYVKEFMSFIGIEEKDITYDQVKIIMDSRESAFDYIKERKELIDDENFSKELKDLIPDIIEKWNKKKVVGIPSAPEGVSHPGGVHIIPQVTIVTPKPEVINTPKGNEGGHVDSPNDHNGNSQEQGETRPNSTEEIVRNAQNEINLQLGRVIGRDGISLEKQIAAHKEAERIIKEKLESLNYDCSNWTSHDDIEKPNGKWKSINQKDHIIDPDGKEIKLVIKSAQGGYIYLSATDFEFLTSSSNNILMVWNGKNVHSVTADDIFNKDSNVNLIFDTEYTPKHYYAALSKVFQFIKRTTFAVKDPNYNVYETIKSFGLDSKTEGVQELFDDDENL